MAVNLSKNGAALMAAYKEVVDIKSDTNWALFTYEGNSNDIRLAGKGDGGLEELVEELNSGKVMYAFCRVQDPNSGLPKFVLINWTGEGVRDARKGLCANHVSNMASFLKGAHVTVNGRDEEDVDPDTILKKVAKASGANFNFHQQNQAYRDTPSGPVGSVYRKVSAVEEIQHTNKDDFWGQAQRDEEVRRREEAKRAEQDRQTLERERREMDEKQARERETRAKEKARQIEEERFQQKRKEEEEREREQQRRQYQQEDTGKKAGTNSPASVQKANEAKALISQRAFNPRDVFKQREQSFEASGDGRSPGSSRPGKLQSPFLSQKSTESEVPLQQWRSHGAAIPVIPMSPTSPVSPQPSPSPASPVSLTPPAASTSPVQATDAAYTEEEEWSDEFDDDTLEETAPQEDVNPSAHMAEREENLYQSIDEYSLSTVKHNTQANGQNICAKAIYDYQAADDTEITFDPHDIITGIEMVDEGWWRGYGPDGRYGMFPANYVELL
ncbi:drebrin-like a isoform X2 [Nelusetta ayraudi]|uniref:drebrin-like a isoform X2 n=1 Tax=Nelusetta ayraudi TaxID=303726 RepID=UPI003F6FBE34